MKKAHSRDASDWPTYLAGMAARTRHPALRRFYQAAWPGPDTPLEEVEFIALDIETTGLNPKRHSILSMGTVPFTLERIRSNQAWHQLIRPQGELAPESVVFHHITHSDIRQAPRFAEVLDELVTQLAGRIAVVHYRAIERNFLDHTAQQVCGEPLLFPVIDTMQIEADMYPRRQPNWLQRMLGQRPVSIRLADSRSRYHLPLYQAHHALTDALATAELLQAQLATHFAPDQRLGDFWC